MFFGKLLAITLLSFCLFQNTVSASEDLDKDPLEGFTVSKEDIIKSLDGLKKMGKISESDYQKAVKELTSMSDAQVSALKETAVGMVRNDPDKAVELVNKGNKIDTEAAKKQIGDLSKPKE